ncbi:MAG: phosphopantothenoylcysteine decarboxylase [Planctomycetota bacterium]
MKILITSGPVDVSIDSVRRISNSASGKTGNDLAVAFSRRGHQGFLLTSRPPNIKIDSWIIQEYHEYHELHHSIANLLLTDRFDAIIMSAAVSDYLFDGYSAHIDDEFSKFEPKIPGHLPEIFLRLKAAPRLVEMIRTDWKFSGYLVIFKLECGISVDELFKRAERLRRKSGADLVVANMAESSSREAWYGAGDKSMFIHVCRENLAETLANAVETGVRNKCPGSY